ncbi:MAG TPA: PAS domain S-box protein, partial [Methanosarcina sp.]|nr:PAS domain S-box protein [Methanosarcina sp.]
VNLFKALLDQNIKAGEVNLQTKGGSSVPVYLSIAPLQENGGQTGWCLVATDLTEEKKREEIVASERLARSIIEQAAEIIIVCDEAGRITHFSNSLPKLCGCDPTFQKFEAIICLQFSEGTDASKSICPVSSALKGATILGVEATFESKNQQKLHFLLNSSPLKNDDGKIIGCVLTLTDITERKKAEEILGYHASLVDNISEAAISTDPDFNILTWNKAAEKMYGWEAAEVLGKPSTLYLKTEYLDNTTQEDIIRQLNEKGFWKGEVIHRRKDGTPIYISASISILKDNAGKSTGVIAVNSDITERKQAEEALKESEERYRLLFETITEGFALHEIILDENGKPCDYRFIDVNPAFEKLTGLKRVELIGKRVFEVLPNTEQYWIDNYGQVALTGEPMFIENYSFELDRWYEVIAYRTAPSQFAVIFTDITERKKVEQEKQLIAENLRYNKERFEILSNINRSLLVSDRPQDIIETLCSQVMKFLDCDAFFNYLMDKDEGCLYLNASAGISDETAKNIGRLDLGEAVCGCVANLGQKIVVEDILEIPDPRTELLKPLGITAYACHPLMDNKEVLGTLSFGTCSRTRFSDEDISMMKAVADAVSVAITRFKTEEALAREQSLLSSVMQATDFMLVFLDPEFNFLWVNPAYAETCQMKPEEMIGKNHFALYPDAENEAIFRQVRDTGEGVFYKDKPFFFPDQPERGITYWDWSLAPAKNPEGKVTGLVFSLRETTKFKKAEKALQESEEKYRNMVETAQEGIWLIDSNGNTAFVNQRISEMLGYSPEEILGQPPQKFIAPEFRSKADEKLRERVQKVSNVIDFRLIRKDGSDLWCILSSSPLFDSQDKYTGTLTMLTDITERKKSEQRILRYNKVLGGISRIFESVVKAETEEELGNLCLAVALEVTGGGIGFVGEVGDDGLLHDIAISNMGWGECLLYEKPGHLLPPGNFTLHGLYGNVIDSGKSFFTNDPMSHLDSIGLPAEHPALKAFLGVPLIFNGKVTGIIGLANREGGYSPEQQKDLEAIASAIIQALQRNKEEQERKKAQKALRCSEEKLRVLVQNVRSGVALIDETGKFALVNPSFLQMFGLDSELGILNVNSQDWSKWEVYGDDGELLNVDEHPVRKVARTGEPVKNQLVAVRNPGADELTWMLISAELVMNKDANTYRVICTYYDITERKRIEKELKEAQELARERLLEIGDLYRNAPIGLCMLDRELRYIRINERLAEINGVAAEAHIGKTVRDVLPQLADVIEPEMLRVIETGVPRFDIELTGETPAQPGVERSWLEQWLPITDNNGNVIGLNIVVEEITERKRLEEKIRRHAEELEVVMNVAPAAVWIGYDPQCDNIVGNRLANEFYEAENGENVSANITPVRRFFYEGRELTADELPMQESASKDIDIRDTEFDVLLPSGKWLSLLGSASPLHDSEGKVRGSIGTFIDITARKQQEEALKLAYEEVQIKSEDLEAQNEKLRKAYQALRESQEQLATIFAASPVGIFFSRFEDGLLKDVNQAYLDIIGYSKEEVIGHTSFELDLWVDPGDREYFVETLIQNGRLDGVEIKYRRKNGDIIDVSVSLLPIELGGELCLLGTLDDITERKRIETALRENEQHLSDLLSSIQDGFFELNQDWQFTYINECAARNVGFEPEDLLGKCMWENFPWTLNSKYETAFKQVMKTRISTRFEIGSLTGGRWYAISVYPAGSGISVFWTEITEQKRAEKVLREAYEMIQSQAEELQVQTEELEETNQALSKSEERLRLLGDNLPESAVYQYMHNPDGSVAFLYFSEGIEKLNSVKAEDVMRDPGTLRRQISQVYCEQFFEAEARSARELSDFDMEVPMELPDGQVRWMQLHSRPRRLPDGRIIWDGVQIDVTKRKVMEDALKKAHDTLERKVKERTAELEEAYNSLLENELRLSEAQRIAHIGNWDRNLLTGELYWSDEMYHIFGLDPLKFRATYDAFLSYVHPEDREYVDNAVKEALKGEHYSIDYRIISGDGVEKVVHARLEAVFNEDKTPVRMRGITQDITERSKAEEALERIDEMRIKEIHHRIKNNLQVISSLLSLEAEKFSDEKMLDAFKESQNRVASMALIHEELYKGDKFDTLDFAQYLQKLTEDLFRSYSLGDKTICLNLNLEHINLGMDTAIPLGIIVNELVSNSLKHAFSEESKGEIQISLCETANFASSLDSDAECQEKSFQYALLVEDSGKGIPEEIDLENTDFLGLQLVNLLVEQIDGCVELKREKGTKFI